MSDAPASPAGERTAGRLLRSARERQGLHIAALAAAIKVSPRKLEALESDRYADLPDATFARALAQTICRHLKVDAREVLDLLPPALSTPLDAVGGSLNTPFRDRGGQDRQPLVGLARRPWVWAAGLLVVAALVLWLVPSNWLMPATAPLVSVPVALPASAATFADAPFAIAAAPEGAATLPAGEALGTLPDAAAPASAPTVSAGALQLRSREASWVEVKDGQGQLLLSRVLQAGEVVDLNGAAPFRLIIGNASTTELVFRGRVVDLASATRDNVARLELPQPPPP